MFTKQSGSGLVETLVSVALGVVVLGAVMHGLGNVISLNKAAREGEHLAEGAAALDSYLKTHGLSIVKNLAVTGFPVPLQPTMEQLKAGTFMPRFIPDTTPFNGKLQFTIRKGVRNDLFGLACDTQNIMKGSVPAPDLAGAVIVAANGAGVRTSVIGPSLLNGPGQVSIPSPITGPAIVCAWAYLPSPI